LEHHLLNTNDMRDQAEENRRRLVQGVAAGTIATVLMTALVVAAPAFAGTRLPELVMGALAGLRAHPLLLLIALAVHFGYGALAGALFAAGAARVTVAAGLFYGLALWGVAVAVYAPLFGLGFLASHEPALAALILPAHLIYGVTLGALAPRGEVVQPIEDRGLMAMAPPL
jgi:hypothetical protein